MIISAIRIIIPDLVPMVVTTMMCIASMRATIVTMSIQMVQVAMEVPVITATWAALPSRCQAIPVPAVVAPRSTHRNVHQDPNRVANSIPMG